MDLNFILFPIIAALLLIIFVIGGWILIHTIRSRGRIARSLNLALFLVTLPKEKKKEEEAKKTDKEIISVMEQFYASLAGVKEDSFFSKFIYGQPSLIFELAVPQVGEEIKFYLACPRRFVDILEKTIHGFYSTAQIEKTEDYNIFNPEGAAVGSFMTLSRSHVLPFKTYQNLEADPLNGISNALSKLEEKGEGAAVQILIRPAAANWARSGVKIAKLMQEGKSFSAARSEVLGTGKVWKTFQTTKPPLTTQPLPQKIITPGEEEIIKAIEGKAAKIGFETNIRLITSAATKIRAEQILSQIENTFGQLAAPSLNSLKSVRVAGRGLRRFIYNFSFRIFDPTRKLILNTEELTSLYHFPNIPLETPKIGFLKAKPAAPPANLPKEGLILGKNTYRGIESVIRLQKDDRRRHLYIIGQTGTGKSVFLQEMIRQDIESGQGVGVVDPHGDLIEKILTLVPRQRIDDVVLCDPTDLERPFGLNMLEYDSQKPEQKTFIVNELINIFHKLFGAVPEALGPMFEQYARNALLLLMDNPDHQFTLMEVPKVLADTEFRHSLLDKCQNPIVKDFWIKEAEKAGGEAALVNMVPYITSKFNIFIANDYMRPIIGQAKSTIDFREIIDTGKILLVNLSKGRLGDVNSSLLGLLFTGKLLIASFARIEISEEHRQDFYLYIDEFQNFTTESIETALSEARKYRLCLTIAHQFIGQLPEKIRDAVFGNVGSIVSFRIGAEDAEFLVKQFEPVFDQQDLINIDNFNAYVKLLIGGATSQSFNIQTYPPTRGSEEIAQAIKEVSRLKYGKLKDEVEQEIIKCSQPAPSPISEPTPTPVSEEQIK